VEEELVMVEVVQVQVLLEDQEAVQGIFLVILVERETVLQLQLLH
jgi:hypothetical protein